MGCECVLGEDEAGLGFVEDVPGAFAGLLRVDGEPGCAGFEGGKDGDEHVHTALEIEGDDLIGSHPHPLLDEVVS